MTSFLSRLPETQKRIVLIGSALILLTTFVYAVAEYKLNSLTNTLTEQISLQEALLMEIADTTARNGVDATTETIIRDCTVTERNEFDTLLGRLDSGLSKSEIDTLDRLFGRCGYFYAERKSIMVARLVREISVYGGYVEQLKTLKTFTSSNKYRVETWQELAEAEKRQADFFRELVILQDQIIKALLEEKSVQSEEIKEILTKVSEVQGQLANANGQSATLRATLKTK